MENLKSFDKNELLGLLGLQVKPNSVEYMLPALAVFGAGLVVGASLGLLFAPKTGRETRDELGRRLQQAPEAIARIPERAAELTQKAGEAVQNVKEHAREAVERTRNQVS